MIRWEAIYKDGQVFTKHSTKYKDLDHSRLKNFCVYMNNEHIYIDLVTGSIVKNGVLVKQIKSSDNLELIYSIRAHIDTKIGSRITKSEPVIDVVTCGIKSGDLIEKTEIINAPNI